MVASSWFSSKSLSFGICIKAGAISMSEKASSSTFTFDIKCLFVCLNYFMSQSIVMVMSGRCLNLMGLVPKITRMP